MNYLIRKIFKIPRRLLREIKSSGEYFYFKTRYRTPCLPQGCSQRRLLVGGGEDLKTAARHFRRVFPKQADEKIKEADLICAHVFDLLGSGPRKLSKVGEGYQPIDWHSDFKAGYRWDPKTFYKRIKYGHVRGVDVKVPWELSRFQHLNTLGQAYVLTGEQKYRDEFVNQIIDWKDSNPVAFGVNWACTMDVAIRVANWLVAKELFEESSLPKEFLEKFYVSIYEHGRFIRNHLEYSPKLTTNHYVADLAGLFFIAVYCPFLKESASWQKFCVDELAKEIQKQVYEDGCDFEASTSYHRLVLEMFFYCELLGKSAGIEFPQSYQDKVRKMFECSLYSIKPNGKIPQIGDNDNGRFLIFAQRPVLEHKYLLSLAAIYYQDSTFKLQHFDFDEEAFWVFGLKGKEIYDTLPSRQGQLASKSFPDAGWYIMRRNNDYCFIVCGPNGQNGRGGHAHNDKLSFELMLNGEDVIVDPGTYCYTPYPEWRNKFRSTGYHNTAIVNDIEQNLLSKNLFSLDCGVLVRFATLEEKSDQIIFKGSIELPGGALFAREIKYDKNQGSSSVQDKFESKIMWMSMSRFHFSPELEVRDREILAKKSGRRLARIEFLNKGAQIKPYDYSAAYGEKEQAVALELAAENVTEITVTIIKEIS